MSSKDGDEFECFAHRWATFKIENFKYTNIQHFNKYNDQNYDVWELVM